MGFELAYITGVSALIIMAIALVTKVITVRMLGRVRRGLLAAADVQQALIERADEIKSKRTADESIVKSLDEQKLEMKGRQSRLRKELEQLADESERHERLREARRRSLLR